MKNLMKNLTMLMAHLVPVILSTMLVACGGGNGPAGAPLGPGDIGSNGEITLLLTNASGQKVSVIPTGTVGLVTANVVDVSGDPVPNILVTFTISKNPLAGSISPANGFAATDSSGNAQVTLIPGTSGESGEITATATVIDSNKITDTLAFRVQ